MGDLTQALAHLEKQFTHYIPKSKFYILRIAHVKGKEYF
jgi:hypothetical protein